MFPVIILAIENEDDREFMMQLYTQYRALLYSEIYKIVQNEWDADDVLQSVIEKLIDRLSKLREMEHKGMVNYMITTAKHTAYNFCRDKGSFNLWTMKRISPMTNLHWRTALL